MLTPKDIKDIKEELLPIDDIFNNDSDILDRTKRIFASLDEVDKTILILYMELGSLIKCQCSIANCSVCNQHSL